MASGERIAEAERICGYSACPPSVAHPHGEVAENFMIFINNIYDIYKYHKWMMPLFGRAATADRGTGSVFFFLVLGGGGQIDEVGFPA